MVRFEVGKITNLGRDNSGESDQSELNKEKNPIGFKPSEKKTPDNTKLDRIGFAAPEHKPEHKEEKF